MNGRQTSPLGFAACLLLGALVVEAQSDRGPSTPEERQKALELVSFLESGPSAAEAKDATGWLVTWLSEVPDITVQFCLAPLGSSRERKSVPPELTVHVMFSQAAFQIRNPEADSKSVEVYVAGVEGALRRYSAMRTAGSVPVSKALEKLEQARSSGELEVLVRKRAKECR